MTDGQLAVESHTEGDVALVIVAGEVDMATAGILRGTIADRIAAGSRHLVLDLAGVRFLDSTGLGVLVGARKKVDQVGGSLRIVCRGERVTGLLRLTGLSRVLTVHATRDEACAALAAAVREPRTLV